MYADPADIRKHVSRIRLNDLEQADLEMVAQLLHKQPATAAHDILCEAMRDLIAQKYQLSRLLDD